MTRQFYNALISDFLLQITTSGNNMSIDTENGSGLLILPSCICNKNNKRCRKKKDVMHQSYMIQSECFVADGMDGNVDRSIY